MKLAIKRNWFLNYLGYHYWDDETTSCDMVMRIFLRCFIPLLLLTTFISAPYLWFTDWSLPVWAQISNAIGTILWLLLVMWGLAAGSQYLGNKLTNTQSKPVSAVVNFARRPMARVSFRLMVLGTMNAFMVYGLIHKTDSIPYVLNLVATITVDAVITLILVIKLVDYKRDLLSALYNAVRNKTCMKIEIKD